MIPRLKVLHVAPHAHGYGGIETLLARHAQWDGQHGFDAWQVGLFERCEAGPGEPYRPLQFGWRDTPRGMRRAMARVFGERSGSIVVWHNAWGLPWFADLDGAERRIAVMHADPGYFRAWLPQIRDFLDGVLAVSPAGARAVHELLPGWPADRVACLPLPIDSVRGADLARPLRRPLRLGCAGRLVRAQKRWDRLVPFVRELDRLGVDFRLEIIGRGALQAWLQDQFRNDHRVEFVGFAERADYCSRLQAWDAALFFSDVEGGPIVLLEAMAAGAIPFHPAIGGSLADDYAPQIDGRCLYPPGDMAAAAAAVRDVLESQAARIADLRTRAHALVAPHRGNEYEQVFADFVRRIAARPRISRDAAAARRARWTDNLPLGLITRAFPRELWR